MTLREGPYEAARDGDDDGWWIGRRNFKTGRRFHFDRDLPALRRLLEKLELLQDLRDVAKPKGKRGKR